MKSPEVICFRYSFIRCPKNVVRKLSFLSSFCTRLVSSSGRLSLCVGPTAPYILSCSQLQVQWKEISSLRVLMRIVQPVFMGLTLAVWLLQSILDSLMLSPVTTFGVRDEGRQPHLSHRDWVLLGH